MDHDQRFKTLLQRLFDAFMRLFFKTWAERLDFESLVWLDKEVFSDPPSGKKHIFDLVAQVRAKEAIAAQEPGQVEDFTLLVHVEIESPDRISTFRPYMHRGYGYLRDKYKRPVLPIALFLRVGLEGIGIDVYEERVWEFCPVRFQYFYVGLPALDEVEYVQQDNWLGVALSALMKVPKDRAAWLGVEALRRLHAAPLSQQDRFLLADCVQAYLPLDAEGERELEELLQKPENAGAKAMNKTSYDQGLEKGLERGRSLLLRDVLEERFGPLPVAVQERLPRLTTEESRRLVRAAIRAASLAELGLGSEI